MAYKDKYGELWATEGDYLQYLLTVKLYKSNKTKKISGLVKYWEKKHDRNHN